MEIKYKIWIEKDGKVLFGKGRKDILTTIQDMRSLQAAAKKLKMSYRAAWGRLKASEERTGIKLIEADTTESGRQPTLEAMAIMDRFVKLDKDVQSLLAKASLDFRRLLDKKNK
jgi:molybdate transport system regulatory protein